MMVSVKISISEQEDRTTRRLNRKKKKFNCLGCGRPIHSDRCHRFCRVCLRRNLRGQFYLPRVGRVCQGSAET
jgi:hypothetical protein